MIVSDKPGDPDKEVDPVPEINIDLKRRTWTASKLKRTSSGASAARASNGVNEKSSSTPSTTRRRGPAPRQVRRMDDWTGHVGFNDAEFGGKRKHFDAKPGRYMAILRATDTSNNTGKKRTRRFKFG